MNREPWRAHGTAHTTTPWRRAAHPRRLRLHIGEASSRDRAPATAAAPHRGRTPGSDADRSRSGPAPATPAARDHEPPPHRRTRRPRPPPRQPKQPRPYPFPRTSHPLLPLPTFDSRKPRSGAACALLSRHITHGNNRSALFCLWRSSVVSAWALNCTAHGPDSQAENRMGGMAIHLDGRGRRFRLIPRRTGSGGRRKHWGFHQRQL